VPGRINLRLRTSAVSLAPEASRNGHSQIDPSHFTAQRCLVLLHRDPKSLRGNSCSPAAASRCIGLTCVIEFALHQRRLVPHK
jgi:hypothetical protein